MSRFGKLKSLEISDKKTARYTFYEIEGEPVVVVSPATEVNKPYFNALLKRSRKNQRRLSSGHVSADVIKENRENDRELYAHYILRDWEKIDKLAGEELEPNVENFQEFLNALPDHIFDDLRIFAADPQSFTDMEFDVEETAGNSQSG